MTTNSEREAAILARLLVLEKQLDHLEKEHVRVSEILPEVHNRINDVKIELLSIRSQSQTVTKLESKLNDIEDKYNSLSKEISDVSTIKKIVVSVIIFALTAILGLVINSVYHKPISDSDINQKLDDINKKLSKEYSK